MPCLLVLSPTSWTCGCRWQLLAHPPPHQSTDEGAQTAKQPRDSSSYGFLLSTTHSSTQTSTYREAGGPCGAVVGYRCSSLRQRDPNLILFFFFSCDLEHSPAVLMLTANSAVAFVGAIITHHLLQQAGELLTELEANGAGECA